MKIFDRATEWLRDVLANIFKSSSGNSIVGVDGIGNWSLFEVRALLNIKRVEYLIVSTSF